MDKLNLQDRRQSILDLAREFCAKKLALTFSGRGTFKKVLLVISDFNP